MEFHGVEPFGQQRDDLGRAAQAMWLADVFSGSQDGQISLIHPYFPDADELFKRKLALDERVKNLPPEHAEKLRQARVAHRKLNGH